MNQQHNKTSRRQFVRDAGSVVGSAVAGAALARGAVGTPADAPDMPAMPHATLGRTGVGVSRLGIGCAHFQQKFLSPRHVEPVLQRALELGVNYLDTAPNYGSDETGYAEEKMGPAIPKIRDKVFLVSKTEEPTYKGTWRLLRQSLRRLQTDHLDLVHLHNFGNTERFPDLALTLGDKGALGALREAKKKGVIRFIGASGHLHPSRFHAVLDTGEIDVVMNAVNFCVQHVYDFEHKVFSRAAADNLGLVAMKVLGGADDSKKSFRLPAETYEPAIRYALSIPKLTTAVLGIWNLEQLEQAVRTVADAKPLTPTEALDLSRKGLELAATEKWAEPYGRPLT